MQRSQEAMNAGQWLEATLPWGFPPKACRGKGEEWARGGPRGMGADYVGRRVRRGRAKQVRGSKDGLANHLGD